MPTHWSGGITSRCSGPAPASVLFRPVCIVGPARPLNGVAFKGTTITALVDGKPVLNTSHDLYPRGMAGLLCGVHGDRFGTAYFDNVSVTCPNEAPPPPAVPAAGQTPIYNRP